MELYKVLKKNVPSYKCKVNGLMYLQWEIITASAAVLYVCMYVLTWKI